MTVKELAEALESLMKHGGAPLVMRRRGQPIGLQIVPIHTSGGRRPDGLADGAPTDPGFRFAVAEVALEVEIAQCSPAQRAAVHELLWTAGTDDWMNYSHFGSYAPNTPPAATTLGLTFSSGYKGAGVIEDVLMALAIPLEEVTASG